MLIPNMVTKNPEVHHVTYDYFSKFSTFMLFVLSHTPLKIGGNLMKLGLMVSVESHCQVSTFSKNLTDQ